MFASCTHKNWDLSLFSRRRWLLTLLLRPTKWQQEVFGVLFQSRVSENKVVGPIFLVSVFLGVLNFRGKTNVDIIMGEGAPKAMR
jgi:hypothetical protein